MKLNMRADSAYAYLMSLVEDKLSKYERGEWQVLVKSAKKRWDETPVGVLEAPVGLMGRFFG